MNELLFINNLADAACVFSKDNKIIFKNTAFKIMFSDFINLEKFKKRFNFNLCYLSSENIQSMTPIDIMLKSKENFHTICTYQNITEEYLSIYIYKFNYINYKIVIFKNITKEESYDLIEARYNALEKKYSIAKENTDKTTKLQEQAQAQILKMGIINRISLIIRETSNLETVLSSALEEINNFMGSYKTYFSLKEKNGFRIKYIIGESNNEIETLAEYEPEIIKEIKEKNIAVSACLIEYLNSKEIIPNGVNRVIIPVYNKNKLLGIIVTLTKQKFSIEDNKEILQSISVHLGSSIIQSGLISQLNKKNKKLNKTLTELKDTQLQLINSEKMASLGQLVSGVAHEINTPLASISSNNKIINKILDSEEITDSKLGMLKELNNIDIEAAERISNIVKSLKRFVRLDEAEFQEADINKELDLTIKLIAHELRDNIKIEKKYSELPLVMCSVNMLNQVFMNILVNSCHSINEKKGDGIITVTTEYDKNNCIIKIKDNGCGISEEAKNKIFNVGYTTKKIGFGTGIGLSISKKIIEAHRGSISFTSKKDEGTEFTISIPLKHI